MLSLAAVAVVSVAVWALEPHAPVVSLGVLYLFAVLPVAALWGLPFAIPVSIVSMLAFNWLFLPPTHTLRLADSENWVALAVYLVTAISVSALSDRARRRTEEAEERRREAERAMDEARASEERRLREAVEAEALRRSDAVKTAVLRSVSHDLRSPITAITTASEVLRELGDSLSEDDRDELVAAILAQVQRLDRLVANLLELSRLEAGAATPTRELWTVDGLVARALDVIAADEDRVDVDLPNDIPPVEVDPAQLERALVNVIENALKFSGPGERVALRATTEGRRGLPPRDRPWAWHPGPRARARLRAVRSRNVGERGSRLGARTRHRARLRRSQRRPALGRARVERRIRVRPRVAGGRASGGRDRMSGARVLVVDDEPQILRALQLKLRGAGYAVDTAATASEARIKASMRPPEAIILDVLLPDGRGTDVCRELRSWSEVPILVLSAVGEEQEKIAALDAGADDYVTKPFSGDELLARLRAALRRTRTSTQQPVVEIGDLRIDLELRHVTIGGEEVALTPIEYDLLRLLAENEGKLITHPTILREIWGPAYAEESNYLHVYVSHLRRKIEPDPARPRYILNQPGVGYRLVDPSGPF